MNNLLKNLKPQINSEKWQIMLKQNKNKILKKVKHKKRRKIV